MDRSFVASLAEVLSLVPASFWVALYLAPATYSVYHALLYKRDIRSATGWIMACVFVPLAGPVAYFLFGINRVRSRARDMRRPLFGVEREALRGRGEPAPFDATVSRSDGALERAGRGVTGRVLTAGNEVAALVNGEAAYPAMLAAIDGATSRVWLSSYIIRSDATGRAFAAALQRAAERGVDVRLLIDGVGELYSMPSFLRLLRDSGVQTARFLPPRLLPPSIHINLRNHRKILIVDAERAFSGGMNISHENLSDAQRPRTVSDMHFALRGPVTVDLARIFLSDWQFARGLARDPDAAESAAPATTGSARCRVIPDGPDDDMDALALTLQVVMSCAQQRIDIMTPYFLPGRAMLAALVSAALRGVQVRVVLPAKNNLWYVHWANRNALEELLPWGVEVYYQPAPFCHTKLLCVDEQYTLLGSANLDERSLRLNFEVGVEVFATELSAQLREHFDDVIAASTPLTLDQLSGRSIPARLRDSALALLSPYL